MDSELLVQLTIVIIDLVVGLLIGFRLGRGRSKKRNIIWGIATILAIGPVLSIFISFVLGYILVYVTLDPLSGVAVLFIMFPLFFFIGLGLLLSSLKK